MRHGAQQRQAAGVIAALGRQTRVMAPEGGRCAIGPALTGKATIWG